MSAAPSIDASSKRWLTVLALAIVASVGILAYSFLKAVAPLEKKSMETQQPATDHAQEVRTGDQEALNHPQPFQAAQEQPTVTSFPPSVAEMRKTKEAARMAMVHRQAEDLRSMVKQNKLPAGYGHLTLEQIDEMEKNGIVIE
jgi:type IV secretory pathway VirB10-like protein